MTTTWTTWNNGAFSPLLRGDIYPMMTTWATWNNWAFSPLLRGMFAITKRPNGPITWQWKRPDREADELANKGQYSVTQSNTLGSKGSTLGTSIATNRPVRA